MAESGGRPGRARGYGGGVLVSPVRAVVSHGERVEVVLGVWERDGPVLMGRGVVGLLGEEVLEDGSTRIIVSCLCSVRRLSGDLESL